MDEWMNKWINKCGVPIQWILFSVKKENLVTWYNIDEH